MTRKIKVWAVFFLLGAIGIIIMGLLKLPWWTGFINGMVCMLLAEEIVHYP